MADSGYYWTQYFPEGKAYAVTLMQNDSNEVVQAYIDIGQHGLSDQGIPYSDDLYLDVIVRPNKGTELIDQDELEQALKDGQLSQADYDFAWQSANALMQALESAEFDVMQLPAFDD